ncbi:MAG: CBS domain-containing protein [Bacillota bacterium]
MPLMHRVKDVMVPVEEYPVIGDDAAVIDAVRELGSSFHEKDGTWYGFQSLLVVGQGGGLVGILTLRGLLKAIKLHMVYDHLTSGDSDGLMFFKPFRSGMDITVRDIMRPLKMVTVQQDSSILEAVQIVCRKKVNSLPVMDGKKLVGIVRTIDLFWSVGELMEGSF